VYSANTLGSILGVFFAAHIGMPSLGLKGLIAAGAALDAGLGLVLLWRLAGAPRLRLSAAALSLACFAAVLAGVQLDAYKMASGAVPPRRFVFGERRRPALPSRRQNHDRQSDGFRHRPQPAHQTASPNGAINMDRTARASRTNHDDAHGGDSPRYRPDATSAAVIGIERPHDAHASRSSALRSVETIEIEPAMAEASRRLCPAQYQRLRRSAQPIIFDDAKTFFSTHNRKYDIIVSERPTPGQRRREPVHGEFYRLARRHLNPEGILVQWFQMYEIDASLVPRTAHARGELSGLCRLRGHRKRSADHRGETRTLARPLAELAAMPGVSRELRRVHVNSMWDIEARRLGGKGSLAPLFLTYGVPANSISYPYLDLHAQSTVSCKGRPKT